MQVFIPISKKERFIIAVGTIEKFLTQYESNYKFKLADSTTNNFQDFKNEVAKNGYITISKQGCNNIIYSHAKYNIIARLWHDNIHLINDFDFSQDSEFKTCQVQISEIITYMDKMGIQCSTQEDVKEVLYHDIIGQVNYYYHTKKYVTHQKKFVFSRFLNNGGV